MVGLAVEDRSLSSPQQVAVTGTLSSATNWAAAAVEIRGGGTSADADGDGQVTVSDVLIMVNNFSRSLTGTPQGDFSGDAKVNLLDFGVWVKAVMAP